MASTNLRIEPNTRSGLSCEPPAGSRQLLASDLIPNIAKRMTRREIVDVQIESMFGSKFPQKIQRLVDEELNQGRWVEGYDLAVSPGGVSGADARELLEIVLMQNPELRIDPDALNRVVEERLPQSSVADVLWIVDESGSFALTDSLRVARFNGASVVWRSPRISYDGIEFDALKNGKLYGRAWLLGSWPPNVPFTFDFETGELIEGQVVDHS